MACHGGTMVAPIIFIVWIAKVTQGSRKSLNNGRTALGRELEGTSVDGGVYDLVGNPIPDCICFTYFSITFRSTRPVLFWHQTSCFTAVHVLTLTVYISRCSAVICMWKGHRHNAQGFKSIYSCTTQTLLISETNFHMNI